MPATATPHIPPCDWGAKGFPRSLSKGMTDSISGQGESITFLGGFSQRLVTNTFFNFVGRCWNFLVALLLTPYILGRLNVHEFGVWVLLTIFTSSFNLLDLGLGAAFVKHI